jgi:hypothetical protein
MNHMSRLSHHYAVLELFGIFAHIPDVPVLVLREIIKGVFNYPAIDRRYVPDDDAVNAEDLFNVAVTTNSSCSRGPCIAS